MIYKSALKLLDINIGLLSNNPDLVQCDEFLDAKTQKLNPKIWSLLTALPPTERIEFNADNIDAFFYIIDGKDIRPNVIIKNRTCTVYGDFRMLEELCSDKRWNIYGNVGIFFAFCLVMLEECAGIHSMHASALYNKDKNLLLVAAGSSGSGKTVLQLEAMLHRGYQVFTTEMTHFRVEKGGCTFYKGSVYDNIRIGNLVYDFPQAIEQFGIHLPDVEDKWETYLPVDFEPWSVRAETLHDPRVVLMFPRIETGRTEIILDNNPSQACFIKAMFENASEKICKSQVLYNGYPCFASFDYQELSQRRLDDIIKLLKMDCITDRIKLLSGPQDCWAWEDVIG